MFHFTRDDSSQRPKFQLAPFRIESWKHNPYVGSFHAIDYVEGQTTNASNNGIMLESKNNPLVGFVRHSPSVSKSMGLKRIISEDPSVKPPILTQMQLKRNEVTTTPLTEKNFVRSLKQIPTTVYSASEVLSPSRRGSIKLDENSEDQCLCAICMEAYADGDEILTLACAHCYHSECASKWFYQDCLNSIDMESNFSCPKCRKNHPTAATAATRSEAGSNSSSLLTAEENLGLSTTLLQIGRSLMQEGGYDFLSDFGSVESPFEASTERLLPKSPYRISPTRCIQRQKSSSTMDSVAACPLPPAVLPTNTNSNSHNLTDSMLIIEEMSTAMHGLTIPSTYLPLSQSHSRALHSPAGSVLSFSAWSDCGVPLQ